MTETTTTTKQAAVWNPPRLRKMAVRGGTRSGTVPGDNTWEVFSGPASCPVAATYRMPNSGEPGSDRPTC